MKEIKNKKGRDVKMKNEQLNKVVEYRKDLREQLKMMENASKVVDDKIFITVDLIENHLSQKTHKKVKRNDYSKILNCNSLRSFTDLIFRMDNDKLDITLLKYFTLLVELRERSAIHKDNIKLITEAIRTLCDIEREFDRYGRCLSGIGFYMKKVDACMNKVRYNI